MGWVEFGGPTAAHRQLQLLPGRTCLSPLLSSPLLTATAPPPLTLCCAAPAASPTKRAHRPAADHVNFCRASLAWRCERRSRHGCAGVARPAVALYTCMGGPSSAQRGVSVKQKEASSALRHSEQCSGQACCRRCQAACLAAGRLLGSARSPPGSSATGSGDVCHTLSVTQSKGAARPGGAAPFPRSMAAGVLHWRRFCAPAECRHMQWALPPPGESWKSQECGMR